MLQVRETRNWSSYGSGNATVGERLRAMQSLTDMLGIIAPVVLPRFADAAHAIACIQNHVECIESACSTRLADLSVELHACLVFTRALEQLRACYIGHMPDPNCDINDIIEDIRRKMKPDQQIACKMVMKGRHRVFHGSDTHSTLLLLQCTCAVAYILRVLASTNAPDAPSRSPKGDATDAGGSSDASAGSATRKTPSAIAAECASKVESTAADACDASVALLMQRIGISDLPSLMKEAVASHDDM